MKDQITGTFDIYSTHLTRWAHFILWNISTKNTKFLINLTKVIQQCGKMKYLTATILKIFSTTSSYSIISATSHSMFSSNKKDKTFRWNVSGIIAKSFPKNRGWSSVTFHRRPNYQHPHRLKSFYHVPCNHFHLCRSLIKPGVHFRVYLSAHPRLLMEDAILLRVMIFLRLD